jgi:DNA-directed RNA polymerase specialized sigma24 family protein
VVFRVPKAKNDTNSGNYEPALAPIFPNSIVFDFPEETPALERTILQLSFGERKTLQEIARILQMSVERVTRQKKKALRRLKSLYPKE